VRTMLMVLRVSALVLGLFLIASAVFLYEDEHKKFQNLLETWWLKIDAKRRPALSRHTRFMQGVAKLTTDGFDRVFGKRTYSAQSFGVSLCIACASIYLYPSGSHNYFPFLMSASYLALAVIPLCISKRRWLIAWFLALITFFATDVSYSFWMISESVKNDPPPITLFPFLFALGEILSAASTIFFIALTRDILKTSSVLRSSKKIGVFILFNCGLGAALVMLPEKINYWSWVHFHYEGKELFWFVVATITNVLRVANRLPALCCVVFIGLALLMLVHRLLWPVLERPMYALQSIGIARRKKLFFVLGISLVGFGVGYISQVIKEIGKIFL
jgi:hypothetical protein